MARMGGVEQAPQGRVVRNVAAFDARAHLGHREPARIDRPAVVERAPDERFADPRLAAGHQVVRPGRVEQIDIDVGGVPVDVEVGARELRRQQRDAPVDGRQPEPVDMAVLAVAQVVGRNRRIEVGRHGVAGVRRVEHDRQGRRRRAVDEEQRFRHVRLRGAPVSTGPASVLRARVTARPRKFRGGQAWTLRRVAPCLRCRPGPTRIAEQRRLDSIGPRATRAHRPGLQRRRSPCMSTTCVT